MNRLGDQLLADAGFAADQHAQVAAGDHRDLIEQAPVLAALADQFAAGLLAGSLAVDLDQLFVVLGAAGQGVDPLGGAHGGGGQAGEGFQVVQVEVVEARRVEGIQSQQAPGLLVDVQRAAQAVVHFQMAVETLDQTVIGVGQRAVGGEAGQAAVPQQALEARVLADPEAPAEGIGAQAVDGQRHQGVAVQAQQGGGIGRQQRAQRAEQAAVAFLLGKVAGQVGHQWDQGAQQGMRCHFDSLLSV
ncbi:hypothetical protein D3C85_499250 [compost metagenome]